MFRATLKLIAPLVLDRGRWARARSDICSNRHVSGCDAPRSRATLSSAKSCARLLNRLSRRANSSVVASLHYLDFYYRVNFARRRAPQMMRDAAPTETGFAEIVSAAFAQPQPPPISVAEIQIAVNFVNLEDAHRAIFCRCVYFRYRSSYFRQSSQEQDHHRQRFDTRSHCASRSFLEDHEFHPGRRH